MKAGTIKSIKQKKPKTFDEATYSYIGNLFLKRRCSMGASRQYLKDTTGVNRATIEGFEKGTINIRVKTMIKLFDKLGLELRVAITKDMDKKQSEINTYNEKSRKRHI